MKEFINQHGESIIEAAGALFVLTAFGAAIFGGGLSGITQTFSKWLYG